MTPVETPAARSLFAIAQDLAFAFAPAFLRWFPITHSEFLNEFWVEVPFAIKVVERPERNVEGGGRFACGGACFEIDEIGLSRRVELDVFL